MPSAVVSRMAPSSSALAWPTGDGSAGGDRFARSRRRRPAASRRARRKDQRQRGIVVPRNREQARVGRRRTALGPAPGSRKSSPACRCPMCCWRSRRRVRHRARRDRRPLPARAGSHSPSAPETRGWHRAAGRAGRSGRRPASDRAAPCRAGFRRAPAARAAPAIPACSLPPVRAGASGLASPAARQRFRRSRRMPPASRRVPFSLSSRADNCRASSLKALFSTGVRAGDFGSLIGRNGRTFFGRFHGCFQIGLV